MQNRGIPLAIAAALISAIACGGSTEPVVAVSNIVTFKATMLGSNEVPAKTTDGAGTFTATLDTVTNVFTYDIIFSGLTSAVTLGHIHGPAAAGVNAGTTVDFKTLAGSTFDVGLQAGKAHGVVTLNAANAITATINGDSVKKLLFAGLAYANIHTTVNGGGEIRGQIFKQ